ncbi:MAG: hypothetical protein JXP34_21155 [Planctomycetes bacterium]|nr:hypothetical protein [Planctomycetota bacterium]
MSLIALALAAGLLAPGPLGAQTPDAMRIETGEAVVGQEDVRVGAILSHSEPLLAVSLAVCVDEQAMSLEGFTVEGSSLADAEGCFFRVEEACGVLGVVLDLDPPVTSSAIPPENDRTIAFIVVRIRPDAPLGEAAIRFLPADGPVGVHNVYTDPLGRDVRPLLVDGAVRVTCGALRIHAVEPALALEGETIRLLGEGFVDDGTLEVLVDGKPVGFQWVDATQLRFQAPALGVETDRIVEVCLAGGCAQGTFGSRPGYRFVRGDANFDARTDLGDSISILQYLFEEYPIPCPDAADANDDARIDIGDAIWLLNYLFVDGPAPPPPIDAAGPDPTADDLLCTS